MGCRKVIDPQNLINLRHRVFSGLSRRTVRANRACDFITQVEFVGPESLSEFGWGAAHVQRAGDPSPLQMPIAPSGLVQDIPS